MSVPVHTIICNLLRPPTGPVPGRKLGDIFCACAWLVFFPMYETRVNETRPISGGLLTLCVDKRAVMYALC